MGSEQQAYREGFEDGVAWAMRQDSPQGRQSRQFEGQRGAQSDSTMRFPKKRKQSGKQKILTQMAKKAWDKYKKGNGKKSYIDIRAQV